MTAETDRPITFAFAEALIETFYATQERTAQGAEAYLKVLQESQKSNRDLALTMLHQMQEVQRLSLQYIRESARTGNEALTDFIRVQDEVQREVKDRLDKQVTEVEKVAKDAAK
jgi:hypothetical protein